MYNDLLAKQKEAFAIIQEDFEKTAKELQGELDEATKKFLEASKDYHYFSDEVIASSTPKYRAAFSDRTAWVMACMSQLAYEPFEREDNNASLGLFVSKLDSGGFTLVDTFNVDGTQAFLAHNSKFAVLAFRGTSDWKDVQTDLTANKVSAGGSSFGKIRMHTGFFRGYELVSKQIVSKLDEVKGLPLYITGHSLGGALATVALRFLEKKEDLKDRIAACYTFGSPRVGNADFEEDIRSPVYRVVNFTDIVTFLPFLTMGFTHVGDVRYLSYGSPKLVRRRRPLSQRLFLLFQLFLALVPAIKNHGIQNYINKLVFIVNDENRDLAFESAMKENQNYNRVKRDTPNL